jgi:hypothetical protein
MCKARRKHVVCLVEAHAAHSKDRRQLQAESPEAMKTFSNTSSIYSSLDASSLELRTQHPPTTELHVRYDL